MKWNIVLASMVLSLGLGAQGFGFELMDRMLGTSGSDCTQKCAAGKCCQNDGACQKDACQKDGCAQKGCAPRCARRSLFGGNSCCQKGDACQKNGCGKGSDCCQKNGCKGDGCGKGNGSCQKDGCGKGNDCCQKGCGGSSLLDRIFSRRQKGSCKSGGKGCGKGCDDKCDKGMDKNVDVMEEDVPVPPAPVVDPSAFLKSQRRVIQASTTLVR